MEIEEEPRHSRLAPALDARRGYLGLPRPANHQAAAPLQAA